MRVLVTTLNSKFIHTALSVRYLKRYYDAYKEDLTTEVMMAEYTINHQIDEIVEGIALARYDLVAFSCYIWNIEHTLKIVTTLKKIQPDIKILLGGPEVTHETYELMAACNGIDYVLIGEGEESFLQFIKAIETKRSFEGVNGLFFRGQLGIQQTPFSYDANKCIAERLPFPYESFEGLEHKILYYESSRGCPYNCKYCLSSTFKGVRYFDMEKVERDLKVFIDHRVMQVKFVDRTFNANRKRALRIMKFIHDHDNGYTNFHLEITASLLDDETLEFLETVRPELFQFEVGVQSTNKETLKEISRDIPFDKVKATCLQIKKNQNIHLHLDLIAGLPHEGLNSFFNSLDDLFAIAPEKIQLGFLKLLKGAQLRIDADKYGMVYRDFPPYEILKTNWLTYEEIITLKHMENLLDYYYNSGKFQYALNYLVKMSKTPFSTILLEMRQLWLANDWFKEKHSLITLYKRLYYFGESIENIDVNLLKELLRLDFLRYNRKKGHDFFTSNPPEGFKNTCHHFLKNEDNVQRFLPRFMGRPAKNIIKQVHFEPFAYHVIKAIESDYNHIERQNIVVLFDYQHRNKIFENYSFFEVELED